MKDSRLDARLWLSQAENDLAYAELLEELAVLDQYYVPTRYPNGLPGVAPFEVYTKKQAETAVATARSVVALTLHRLQERDRGV